MNIFFVGTFPPPVHGMSSANQAIFERLQAEGMTIVKLNIAPTTLKRDLFSRLSRMGRIIQAWYCLLKAQRNNDKLYIALSGGWGQVYDIVSLGIARSRGADSIIHHHSSAYLQNKGLVTSLLVWIAGQNAVHVVLCDHMKNALQTKYGVQRTITLSNLILLPSIIWKRQSKRVQTIGFLSNITKEKGGDIVIMLANAIRENGLPVNVKVAGPCYDEKLIESLHQTVSRDVLEWIAGVYGDDKTQFWRGIDVFVFPTQYNNEAEPYVIWESLTAGVPVIAYDRGCIATQIGHAGEVIPNDFNFVDSAVKILDLWVNRPDIYNSYVKETHERCKNAEKVSEKQWEKLIGTLYYGMASK